MRRFLAFIKALCERKCGNTHLAKALAHPLRVRILAIASQRPVSPVEFARQSGESLERVRYHFRQLVRHGALELIAIRQAEGSTGHLYRATASAVAVGLALTEEAPGATLGREDLL